MQKDWARQHIKGRIAEHIFDEMFRDAKFGEERNYTVIPFGYETVMPELMQTVKGTKYKELVNTIRDAPDFALVRHAPTEVLLVEVKYRSKLNGRPSDMVYKGFESLYRFGNLLIIYGADLIEHLSNKDFKLFNEFDFQPVKSYKEKIVPDYFENKKLYFIRKVDTQIKSIY